MTYLEMRTWVAKVSGRMDLVTSLYADNGMNSYLLASFLDLDLRVFPDGYYGRKIVNLAVDGNTINIINNLFITGIYIVDPDTNIRTRLKKQDLEVVLSMMGDSEESAKPLYYTQNVILFAPDQIGGTPGDFDGAEDIDLTPTTSEEGLLIFPAADKIYSVHIWGKWRTPAPSSESTGNLWTEKYPYVTMLNTVRLLEVEVGNRSAAKALDEEIEKELLKIGRIGVMRETEDDVTERQG